MSRVSWAITLAALFAALAFNQAQLLAMPEAQRLLLGAVCLLAVIVCALGLILPPKKAEPAQAVVLAVGVFVVVAGMVMSP